MAENLEQWVKRVTTSDKSNTLDYFIAGPYTHPNSAIKKFRYDALTRAYAQCIAQRHSAVCCITLTHPPDEIIAKQKGMDTLGSDFWTDADVPFMNIAKALIVIKLPGWEQSHGTQKEIEYFRAQGKPVYYVEPNEFILGKSDIIPDHFALGEAEKRPRLFSQPYLPGDWSDCNTNKARM